VSAEENAARQIGALQQLKKSQNKTEAKVDSRLVVEQRARTSRSATAALPRLNSGVPVASGKVLVDVRGTVTDDLLKALTNAGASLKSVSTRYGTVRAELPLSAVNTVAARADVTKVEAAGGAMTARGEHPPRPDRPRRPDRQRR